MRQHKSWHDITWHAPHGIPNVWEKCCQPKIGLKSACTIPNARQQRVSFPWHFSINEVTAQHMSRMSTHYAGNSPAMSSHNQGRFDKLCSTYRPTPSIGTEVLNTICKSLQGETCPQIFGFLPSPKFPSQLAVKFGQYWCPWLGWWSRMAM